MRGTVVKGLCDLCEKRLGLGSLEDEEKIRARAELAGTGEYAVGKFLGDLVGALGERIGEER